MDQHSDIPAEKTARKQRMDNKKSSTRGYLLFLNRIKSARKRIPPELMGEYRKLYLTSDIAEARFVIFLIALAIGLLSIGDYMFFGPSLIFYLLVAVRLSLIVYSWYHIRFLSRVANYRSYDRSTLVYLLAVVFGLLLLNSSRAPNFIPHIILADVGVFVLYLVIPIRFLYQAIAALTLSAGEGTMLIIGFQMQSNPDIITAIYSLIFANVAAALSSLQFHSYRWRIFQSINERKEAERLITIGQTAGMVGHDIRNPLQAVVSELYLQKQSLEEAPESEVKQKTLESIKFIEDQIDYISKIVADLQDYASPLKPQYKEVDLPEIVTSILATVKILEGITASFVFHGTIKMATDPVFLRRALINLANNAIQAMPEGGKLTVTAEQKDDQAIVRIKDTGKGIPEEVKPKLFKPLFTTKSKGQGFGLAVTKRLIEALGGTITFESEVNKGTEFIVTLPIV